MHPPIFYICNDPERALGLEKGVKNFHIICIDDNPIIDYLQNAGANVLSLNRATGEKNGIYRNSKIALEHQLTQNYIKDHTPSGQTPNAMFFKIAANIEYTAQKLGYKVLNTNSTLNKRYENKISQYETLSQFNIKFPPTLIASLNSLNYKELKEKFGEQFVVQFDHGHTGNSTTFIVSEAEFTALQNTHQSKMARVAQKINGKAFTLNAVATRYGTVYSGLCEQITGVRELTEKSGATVGNDWTKTRFLSDFALSQIKEITEKVGDLMFRDGYRGLFGLDLIVSENNQVYLIEINARQPASTGTHTKLMLKNSLIPLQLFHMSEFLYPAINRELKIVDGRTYVNDSSNINYSEFISSAMGASFNERSIIHEIDKINRSLQEGFNASQFIYRNSTGQEITIQDNIIPGIYKDGKIQSKDYNFENITDSSQYLLLHAAQGMKVSSSTEIARVIQPKGFEISDINRLKPFN